MMSKSTVLFLIVLLLPSYNSMAQQDLPQDVPPTLKNGKRLDRYLKIWPVNEFDTFFVITVKFKVTNSGFLDSLTISENAPAAFVSSVQKQLFQLDGKWNPQRHNGEAVRSKWIVSNYYMKGLRKDTTHCAVRSEQEFINAYKREESLFLCKTKLNMYVKTGECQIDYIEGPNYYLLPPFLSYSVVQDTREVSPSMKDK